MYVWWLHPQKGCSKTATSFAMPTAYLRKEAPRPQYYYHLPCLRLTSERRLQGPNIIIICHAYGLPQKGGSKAPILLSFAMPTAYLRKEAPRPQYYYHLPCLRLTSERRLQGPNIIIICIAYGLPQKGGSKAPILLSFATPMAYLRKEAPRPQYYYHLPLLRFTSEREF